MTTLPIVQIRPPKEADPKTSPSNFIFNTNPNLDSDSLNVVKRYGSIIGEYQAGYYKKLEHRITIDGTVYTVPHCKKWSDVTEIVEKLLSLSSDSQAPGAIRTRPYINGVMVEGGDATTIKRFLDMIPPASEDMSVEFSSTSKCSVVLDATSIGGSVSVAELDTSVSDIDSVLKSPGSIGDGIRFAGWRIKDATAAVNPTVSQLSAVDAKGKILEPIFLVDIILYDRFITSGSMFIPVTARANASVNSVGQWYSQNNPKSGYSYLGVSDGESLSDIDTLASGIVGNDNLVKDINYRVPLNVLYTSGATVQTPFNYNTTQGKPRHYRFSFSNHYDLLYQYTVLTKVEISISLYDWHEIWNLSSGELLMFLSTSKNVYVGKPELVTSDDEGLYHGEPMMLEDSALYQAITANSATLTFDKYWIYRILNGEYDQLERTYSSPRTRDLSSSLGQYFIVTPSGALFLHSGNQMYLLCGGPYGNRGGQILVQDIENLIVPCIPYTTTDDTKTYEYGITVSDSSKTITSNAVIATADSGGWVKGDVKSLDVHFFEVHTPNKGLISIGDINYTTSATVASDGTITSRTSTLARTSNVLSNLDKITVAPFLITSYTT